MERWTETVTTSFSDLWHRVIEFLPVIIGAIVIILVGSMVAKGVSTLVTNILKEIWTKRINKHQGLRSVFGAEEAMQKGGFKINVPTTVGTLVYWFIMVVFLMAATEILNLTQVTNFLNNVLLYLPHVVVGVIILLIGIIFATLASNLVKHSMGAARLASAHMLAAIAKWAILVFTIMAALVQLRVASELIQILFTGFVAMIAIAGGLAFGLGGKDQAQQLLSDMRREFTNKK